MSHISTTTVSSAKSILEIIINLKITFSVLYEEITRVKRCQSTKMDKERNLRRNFSARQ